MTQSNKRWQDSCKTIYQTDLEWLYVTAEGQEVLEVAQELDSEGKEFLVYRFDIPRLKLVPDDEDSLRYSLVTYHYDASWPHSASQYEEWFAEDLGDIARSTGFASAKALVDLLCSEAIRDRARAYEAIGSYHGFDNLDSYPLRLSEEELNARWTA